MTAPEISDYLSIPGSTIELDKTNVGDGETIKRFIRGNNTIDFKNTLLDYYLNNFTAEDTKTDVTKIDGSFILKLFFDYQLRDNLEHFVQYLLRPNEEFYYYFISEEFTSVIGTIYFYYDQIIEIDNSGIVSPLIKRTLPEVQSIFIKNNIFPYLKIIKKDFIKALTALLSCLRILITGKHFATEPGTEGNVRSFIDKSGSSWVVVNKILELGIFIRDSIMYYQTQQLNVDGRNLFSFSVFLNNVIKFSDMLDLEKLEEEKKNAREASKEKLEKIEKKIGELENKKYDFNLEQIIEKLKKEYDELPLKFVILDELFKPESFNLKSRLGIVVIEQREQLNNTSTKQSNTKNDSLFEKIKNNEINFLMLLIFSIKFDTEKNSEYFGAYRIDGEKQVGVVKESQTEIEEALRIAGVDQTITTETLRLELLGDAGNREAKVAAKAAVADEVAAAKEVDGGKDTKYKINFQQFIRKEIFQKVAEINVYEMLQSKTDQTVKTILTSGIYKNILTTHYNTLVPVYEDIKDLQNFDEELIKKEASFKKKSSIKSAIKPKYLNPLYWATKLSVISFIQIITTLHLNKTYQGIYTSLQTLYDIKTTNFFKTFDDIYTGINEIDKKRGVEALAYNKLSIGLMKNQAIYKFLDAVEKNSFFYLISPIKLNFILYLIDKISINKISNSDKLLSQEIEAKYDDKKKEMDIPNENQIINFNFPFAIYLTELKIKYYNLILPELIKLSQDTKSKKILAMAFVGEYTKPDDSELTYWETVIGRPNENSGEENSIIYKDFYKSEIDGPITKYKLIINNIVTPYLTACKLKNAAVKTTTNALKKARNKASFLVQALGIFAQTCLDYAVAGGGKRTKKREPYKRKNTKKRKSYKRKNTKRIKTKRIKTKRRRRSKKRKFTS